MEGEGGWKAEVSERGRWVEGGGGWTGEVDEGAAIRILLDSYDTMGIGYMALWGFRAKCVSG